MTRVSIIVLTYNPQWEKLRSTIISVLRQNAEGMEIIFADDGSDYAYRDEIDALLNRRGIEYRFVGSGINQGTVNNIANAMEHVQGKYVKLISPGDFLYAEDTVARWVDYAERMKADACFGDCVFYSNANGGPSACSVADSPANIGVFERPIKRSALFVDYLLANDTILGASLLYRSDVFKAYIRRMAGRVKYAEDYSLRLMVFAGESVVHYPEKVVWYEYGSGISTGANQKWQALLHKDFEMTDEIILEEIPPFDAVSRRYISYLKQRKRSPKTHRMRKLMLFPTLLVFRWRMKRGRKTPAEVELGGLKRIIEPESRETKNAGN